MPTKNEKKKTANDKFYDLLKEIVDSQTTIIAKLDRLYEEKNKKAEDGTASASAWARM